MLREVKAKALTAFHIGRDLMLNGEPVGRLSDVKAGPWYMTLYVGGQVTTVRKNARVVFA